MAVTRRSLAKILAGAAAVRAPGAAQDAADADLQSAREQMRTNALTIAKVKLPMATEPAFQFRA